LSDPDKKVAKAYGVVTPEREVPYRWTYYIGSDGTILYIDKEVKTNTAGADIAARLEALGIEKK
jgi:peroxiredoxin Q/BCP